jgi:hypothetical protein
MGEAWTIPCVQIWPGGLVPGVAVVAQSWHAKSLNSTTTFTTRTRTLYLKLTLKDLDWKPWVLPFTEVPKVKVLINREMNEHDGWVASPDLPMLYLHFIVVYLKCVETCSNYRYQWYKTCGGIFEFFQGEIRWRRYRHAPLGQTTRSAEQRWNITTSARMNLVRWWSLVSNPNWWRHTNLLFVSPSSSIEPLVLERPFVFCPFGSVKTLERI